MRLSQSQSRIAEPNRAEGVSCREASGSGSRGESLIPDGIAIELVLPTTNHRQNLKLVRRNLSQTTAKHTAVVDCGGGGDNANRGVRDKRTGGEVAQ